MAQTLEPHLRYQTKFTKTGQRDPVSKVESRTKAQKARAQEVAVKVDGRFMVLPEDRKYVMTGKGKRNDQ